MRRGRLIEMHICTCKRILNWQQFTNWGNCIYMYVYIFHIILEFPEDEESDQEDFFTTEREIFHKHKGEKRKKTNSQEYSRKIKETTKKKTKKTTKETSSSNLWVNKCQEPEKYNLLNTNIDDIDTNKSSENYFESESKENQINNSFLIQKPSSSSLLTKTGLTGCKKPSKWSKCT